MFHWTKSFVLWCHWHDDWNSKYASFQFLIMHLMPNMFTLYIFAHWQSTKYTHLKIQRCGNYEYFATIIFVFPKTKIFSGYLFMKF